MHTTNALFQANGGGGTIFKDIYYRNNRRGGQKNLRCFPNCGEEHNPYGFCGQPVLVEYNGPPEQERIFVYAKFEAVTCPTIQKDQIVPKAGILDKLKSSQQPLAEWMQGEQKTNSSNRSSSMCFEINAKRGCWHYGWLRNHGNNVHQLRVYFFLEKDQENYICIEKLISPSFQVVSTRRKDAPALGKSSLMSTLSTGKETEGTLSPVQSITKKRKLLASFCNARALDSNPSESRVNEIISNLSLLYRSVLEIDEFESTMTKMFQYVTQSKFISVLQIFMQNNTNTVSKQGSLTKAYVELLLIVHEDIDNYLKTQSLSINLLVRMIKKKLQLAENKECNDPASLTSSSLFMSFVSQMQLLKIAPTLNTFLPITSEIDNKNKLLRDGKYQCQKSSSTFYNCNWRKSFFNNFDFHLRNVAYDTINIKTTDSIIQVRSEKSVLADTFAEFKLDDSPHFCYMTIMGIANSQTGKGGYVGSVETQFKNGRFLLVPTITEYFFITNYDQVQRKRTISSYIMDPEDTKSLQVHINYQVNVANETLSVMKLRSLDTQEKILCYAKWKSVKECTLVYDAIGR